MVIHGQPQHIIVRGNNRSEIFCCEMDYRFYLEKLLAACKKHDCQVHAYVLMTPFSETGLSKSLQMLGRYYVQYFNSCYRRTGTLWEGRYKATLIDSESYLLACMRYIELNPVRAGMVNDPGEYPWSSYRFNALGQTDELVTPHFEFQRLGTDDGARQAAYRVLFNRSISEAQIIEIRAATGSRLAIKPLSQELKRVLNSLAQ